MDLENGRFCIPGVALTAELIYLWVDSRARKEWDKFFFGHEWSILLWGLHFYSIWSFAEESSPWRQWFKPHPFANPMLAKWLRSIAFVFVPKNLLFCSARHQIAWKWHVLLTLCISWSVCKHVNVFAYPIQQSKVKIWLKSGKSSLRNRQLLFMCILSCMCICIESCAHVNMCTCLYECVRMWVQACIEC